MARFAQGGGRAGIGESEALGTLKRTADSLGTSREGRDIKDAIVEFERALTQRNEARDRAVKAMIRAGAFLASKVVADITRARGIDAALRVAREDVRRIEQKAAGHPDTERIIEEARSRLSAMEGIRERVQRALDNSLSYYGDVVVNVTSDYGERLIESQLGKLEAEFRTKKSPYLIRYARLFVKHSAQYRSGTADKERWFRDISQARE